MYKSNWEVKLVLCFIALVVCVCAALYINKHNSTVVVSADTQPVSMMVSNQVPVCEGLACLFPALNK